MSGAETFRVSAEAYDRHVGRYSAQLASELIGFAGVQPGMRAIDVGCGPGALTTALASGSGPRTSTARIRRSRSSTPAGRGCRGSASSSAAAEALPFNDGAFDAALSQLVVNFMTDAEAGCARWRA